MRETKDAFRFKQFQITQHQNVHRVGTDGVLLGAWANVHGAKNILDVGTGTGLIALMLAQRADANCLITAIEPDTDSFVVAQNNFDQSAFKNKIETHNISLEQFGTELIFDSIVCNPPFFDNSLKPPSQHRMSARHTEFLKHDDLIKASMKMLKPSGMLSLILPAKEGNKFLELATSSGLYTHRKLAVFSKQSKAQERWLIELALVPTKNSLDDSLTIMTTKGAWTDEFKMLTQDFYLNF